MKKLVLYTGITVVIGLVFMGLAFPASYTIAYRELANTFTTVQTFAGGIAGDLNIVSGNLNVTTDGAIGYEGASGNTYTTRDADTGCILTYTDGTLTLEVCNGYARAFCTSSGLGSAPGGAFCWDAANGVIRFKDAEGEWSQ